MTLKHTRELDIYYNEHRKACTNCGQIFKDGDGAHLGYLKGRQYAVLCDKCSYLLEETVVRYHWQETEYEEPSPEDMLWRYMDLSKFIAIISRNDLYFAAANTFEDIFEGAKGIIDKKSEWNIFYLNFFKEAILTAPGQDTRKLTDEQIKLDSERLLNEINNLGQKDRENTYISCWHLNNYESEAMWKLYSKDVTNAIAIQTTAGHLYEALNREPYINIGKVKYIDLEKRFTSINGAFWYKRKSFEFEKEVRAIIRKHDSKENGIYIPVNIDKLIDGIYVSPYASEWFLDVVKSVVTKYNINIPVSYSQMTEKPFY